jgi:hypothetical protein
VVKKNFVNKVPIGKGIFYSKIYCLKGNRLLEKFIRKSNNYPNVIPKGLTLIQ